MRYSPNCITNIRPHRNIDIHHVNVTYTFTSLVNHIPYIDSLNISKKLGSKVFLLTVHSLKHVFY